MTLSNMCGHFHFHFELAVARATPEDITHFFEFELTQPKPSGANFLKCFGTCPLDCLNFFNIHRQRF